MVLSTVLISIIVLSLLVFVHELGHFLAAKKTGIKVEEFGFGYPPRIFGKKVGETIYSLNLIPFGGFVRLLGEDGEGEKKLSPEEIKRAFFSKSKWVRVLVLTAGILGNFLLGTICFAIVYFKLGIPRELNYIKVVKVLDNSPADKAGLENGDHILKIDEYRVASNKDFMALLSKKGGQEIRLTIAREAKVLKVIPRKNPNKDEGRLGIIITDTKLVFYPWWKMPFLTIWEGVKESMMWSWLIIGGIVTSIREIFSGITPQVAGPVGIFRLTGIVASQGILDLIQFVGILSINLAVLNLLPIPALDGGHLVFILLDNVFEKKRREKIEHQATVIGFTILVILMILVTAKDLNLLSLFKKSSFFSFLRLIF